LIILKYFC